MKYLVIAFIISISLHYILFNSYIIINKEKKESALEKGIVKQSSIHYVKLQKAEPKKIENKQTKKPPKKVEKKKEKPKKPPKKIVKKEKPKKKEAPKKVEKKKTVKKQEIKKAIKKPLNKPKKVIKQVKEKSLQDILLKEQIVDSTNSIQQKTLEDFLEKEQKIDPVLLEEINRVYGKEFETFTRVQKAFIIDYFQEFRIVTQKTLSRMGYPRLASRLGLEGTNVVEFIVQPDGSIKDLKITTSSGYEIFDKYTLEMIEIAYKDYPKPKTPTKVKFNVIYSHY